MSYTTYANVSNPHVTIHKDGCTQIRKHGGKHKNHNGHYASHNDFTSATTYANSTQLPVRNCFFCKPGRV